MSINHSDRCWWAVFIKEVRKAFMRNDIELKAYLYEQYERHMAQRLSREYHHYKRLDFQELKSKGLIDRRLGYYDWLAEHLY